MDNDKGIENSRLFKVWADSGSIAQSAKVRSAMEDVDKEDRSMTWPKGSPSRLPCDAQFGDSVPHVPAEAEAKVEKASPPGCLVAPKGDGKERLAEGKDDAVRR